jgi:hypothetical protein
MVSTRCARRLRRACDRHLGDGVDPLRPALAALAIATWVMVSTGYWLFVGPSA